MKQVP